MHAGALLAHFVPGGALPVPVWLLAYAGLAVVGLALVGALATPARDRPRSDLVEALEPAAGPLRWVGLAAWVLLVVLARLGPDSAAGNVAPVAVLVLVWIGIPFAALVLGDVMARIGPFDPLVQLLERRRRVGSSVGLRPTPIDAGRAGARAVVLTCSLHSHVSAPVAPRPAGPSWTGAAFLFVFAWYLLAYHRPGSPRALSLLLVVYGLVAVAGGLRWGRAWLRTGEGFGALSATLAGIRRRDAALHRGAPAVAVVWLGATTFDALGNTDLWFDLLATSVGWERTAVNTIGLMWVTATIAAVVLAARRLAARATGVDSGALDRALTAATVAVAAGWFVTNNLTLAAFEGQNLLALISDPVSRGWDVFGTIERGIDMNLVESPWVRWAQLGALALGHGGAVLRCHRAASALGPRRALHASAVLAVPIAAAAVGAVVLLLV